ncbi:MAG: class I SAM-dependent methyltransferase, partial [Myxococcales bacterium]|nr:class I SAM-dependent methyltransferase [Myxococcales bacterium]
MTDSRSATLRRFEERVIASGEVIFPAVPALRSDIVSKLQAIFEGLKRPLNEGALAELNDLLEQKLADAFAAAPQSNVFVRYQLPRGSGAPTFAVASAKSTLEEEYDHWVSTRTGSLFGASADAMVLHVATEISHGRALDVGAGAGRNTRALAELGFDVVALELSPALSDITRDELDREGVKAEVVCGDVFDPRLELPVKDGFDFVVVAEVVPHLRSVEQFKALLERLAGWSTPQARVLASVFVSDPGFELDEATRQICQ